MSGVYSDEYQMHYWALVGKLSIGDESISIAVPLVMFNYPQKVTGASVDFDLKDVEEMSVKTKELAELKAGQLNEFMAEISEKIGVQEWQIVPTMTCHTHPGRMNSFSGTDYCKDLDEPGIVYPLSIGVNQPSFSSIVCHIGQEAEMVHTEFRIFNGDDDKKEYTYGTCMTYVKAAKRDVPEQSPLDAVLQRNIPKEDAPYYFKDRLTGNEGQDFLFEVANIFEKYDYEIDTSLILEDNVTARWGKVVSRGKGYWQKFWDSDDEEEEEGANVIFTATKMKKDLVDSGLYTYAELYGLDGGQLTELYEGYKTLLEDNDVKFTVTTTESDTVEVIVDPDVDDEDEYWKKIHARDQMVQELLTSGAYRVQDFAGLSYGDIEALYTKWLSFEDE